MSSDDSHDRPANGGFLGKLGAIVSRTAVSAQEVFSDSELRRKAREKLVQGVGAGVKGIGATAEYVRRNVVQNVGGGLESGKKGVQGVLERVQLRLQQQRVNRALQLTRDTPVDIQIGFHVYQGVPQEMRSRYWLVLVQRPELVKPFQELGRFPDLADYDPDRPHPGSSAASSSQAPQHKQQNEFYFVTNPPPRTDGQSHEEAPHASDAAAAAQTPDAGDASLRSSSSQAAASQIPDISDNISDHTAQTASMGCSVGPIVRGGEVVDESDAGSLGDQAAPHGAAAESGHRSEQDADEWEVVNKLESLQDSKFVGPASFANPVCLPRGSSTADDSTSPAFGANSGVTNSTLTSAPNSPARPLATSTAGAERAEAKAAAAHGQSESGSKELPQELKRRQQEAAALRLKQAMDGIKTSMIALPWPVKEQRVPGSKYDTLLQVTLGQEEVEEVIRRDIHRTFPEHPRFLLGQGQEELFNVLKAYSMVDMEVGYCQGMAFVAGILLMYMPEQLAFQVFCQLLAADGPNVRRYYLPGLDDLKLEMAKFEWLLQRHLPRLSRHLAHNGVPCVLYASQWLLTIFACPFPVDFTARLIDVMLLERTDCIMMQTAMAIMAECEESLLRLDDFEDIITLLKTEPCQWSDDKLRGLLTAAYLSSVSDEELSLAREMVTVENVEKMMNSPAGPRRKSQTQQSATLLHSEGTGLDGPGDSAGSAHGSEAHSGTFSDMQSDIAGLVEQQMDTLKWAGPVERRDADVEEAGRLHHSTASSVANTEELLRNPSPQSTAILRAETKDNHA